MHTQGRTETFGRTGQANNLVPLQIDILLYVCVQQMLSEGGRR